ncbi:hypothetical protein OAS19_04335 [Altererythrobacter sp.]|nr:hypothetical protein [Altererythrobacter sp.]
MRDVYKLCKKGNFMSISFRADEAAELQFDRAKRYLISHDWPAKVRQESEDALRELTYKYGPVISGYPTWHPLVKNHDPKQPEVWPSDRTGYSGLDHTIGFANAFLTCPYAASGNVDQLIQSLRDFSQHHAGYVSLEPVDVHFYSMKAQPVLVECDWSQPLEPGCQIPKSLAVPLMIETEMKCWGNSQLAERWDTMRPYLLGEPHGARSSLFVSQETAIAIKKTYLSMVETGMFGPLRMG